MADRGRERMIWRDNGREKIKTKLFHPQSCLCQPQQSRLSWHSMFLVSGLSGLEGDSLEFTLRGLRRAVRKLSTASFIFARQALVLNQGRSEKVAKIRF